MSDDTNVHQAARLVAVVVQSTPYEDGSPRPGTTLLWKRNHGEDSFPIGTKIYAAPPSAPAAVPEALTEFRDTVLNQRGLLAENGMTSEQINDVLSEFDAAIDTAYMLSVAPREGRESMSTKATCGYPWCHCPIDKADWCAKGLPEPNTEVNAAPQESPVSDKGSVQYGNAPADAAPRSREDTLEIARQALPEFRQQDDYLLAHGASLMSEHSHEIIHIDTLRRIIAALRAQPERELLKRARGKLSMLQHLQAVDELCDVIDAHLKESGE
jgi:hypothetical protein